MSYHEYDAALNTLLTRYKLADSSEIDNASLGEKASFLLHQGIIVELIEFACDTRNVVVMQVYEVADCFNISCAGDGSNWTSRGSFEVDSFESAVLFVAGVMIRTHVAGV